MGPRRRGTSHAGRICRVGTPQSARITGLDDAPFAGSQGIVRPTRIGISRPRPSGLRARAARCQGRPRMGHHGHDPDEQLSPSTLSDPGSNGSREISLKRCTKKQNSPVRRRPSGGRTQSASLPSTSSIRGSPRPHEIRSWSQEWRGHRSPYRMKGSRNWQVGDQQAPWPPATGWPASSTVHDSGYPRAVQAVVPLASAGQQQNSRLPLRMHTGAPQARCRARARASCNRLSAGDHGTRGGRRHVVSNSQRATDHPDRHYNRQSFRARACQPAGDMRQALVERSKM